MKITIGLKTSAKLYKLSSTEAQLGFGGETISIPVVVIPKALDKYNVGSTFYKSGESMLSIPVKDVHYLLCSD